jgi:hypothetical protein
MAAGSELGIGGGRRTVGPGRRRWPVCLRGRSRSVCAGRRRWAICAGRRRWPICAWRRRRSVCTGRRRRWIVAGRRRRRAIRNGAAYNGAGSNAAQNTCANGAADTTRAGRRGSGQCRNADTRRADKRDDRLVHVFSSGIAGSPILHSLESLTRESPLPPESFAPPRHWNRNFCRKFGATVTHGAIAPDRGRSCVSRACFPARDQ